jgi:hypothetical protein
MNDLTFPGANCWRAAAVSLISLLKPFCERNEKLRVYIPAWNPTILYCWTANGCRAGVSIGETTSESSFAPTPANLLAPAISRNFAAIDVWRVCAASNSGSGHALCAV